MSSFDTSSSLLIDFSTRVVWSGTKLGKGGGGTQSPGLLATLSPPATSADHDFGFCFRFTEPILGHFLFADKTSALQTKNQTNSKKFRCAECQFCCVNSAQLAGHMRKHTGERPFECPQIKCGKRFARKEELTRHVRIHTGQRPYQCCICEKRFGRKDHLNKHMNVHVTRYADPLLQRAVCKFFAHLTTESVQVA